MAVGSALGQALVVAVSIPSAYGKKLLVLDSLRLLLGNLLVNDSSVLPLKGQGFTIHWILGALLTLPLIMVYPVSIMM